MNEHKISGEIVHSSKNSYEFGRAGNRHKIYYTDKADAEEKIATAKSLQKLTEELV